VNGLGILVVMYKLRGLGMELQMLPRQTRRMDIVFGGASVEEDIMVVVERCRTHGGERIHGGPT
jgi:hypothetical protein